jgi:hypothetical protein
MKRPMNDVWTATTRMVCKSAASSLVAIAAASAVTVCQAQLTNPDFEASGTTLLGWATTGDAEVLDANTAASGGTPLAGTPQSGVREAFISTIRSSGGKVVPSALETFLGLQSGMLPSATVYGGSAMMQTFHAEAGQVLTFGFSFLSENPASWSANNDFAFAVIRPSGVLATSFDTLASVNSSSFSALNPGAYETTYFTSITGWNKTFSRTFSASGDYVLGFGVVDVYGTDATSFHGGNSGLYVDDVKLAPVPEPKAWSMLAGFGLCAVAAARRLARFNLLGRSERTVV